MRGRTNKMKCSSCGEKFAANMNSPSPGGFSSPGIFFIINVILIASLIVLIDQGYGIYAFFVGLILLYSLGANLTSWYDSNREIGPGGIPSAGLSCPRCGRKNRVYPWSL
jgi:hypothetical protein